MRLLLVAMLAGCGTDPNPHELTTCGEWNESPEPTTCELACERPEGTHIYATCVIANGQGAPSGKECSSGYFAGSLRSFDGAVGCCMVGLDGDPSVRRWYTCQQFQH